MAASASGDGADDSSAMREQMAVLEQLVRAQAQQLQQLRALPAHSAQPSPQVSLQPSPLQPPRRLEVGAATAAPAAEAGEALQSRFARKEPRAQDLREYDGAAGAKLDEWLQELALATFLYKLNALEASSFGVSRLRGAALQWWLALSGTEQEALAEPNALGAALRSRFQPVTAARVARAQLDALRQGARHVNDYIADFQRLHTQIGAASLGDANALHAFERGLRADIAEKLRVAGVDTLPAAIAMAARVGNLTSTAAAAPLSRAAANQMDVDDGDGAPLGERIDQLQATLNAMRMQQARGGSATGLGAKTLTQRGYASERGGSGARGGARSGRGGRGGFRGTVPGVSADVAQQRWDAGQCLRCGSADHKSLACPNAIFASQSSF